MSIICFYFLGLITGYFFCKIQSMPASLNEEIKNFREPKEIATPPKSLDARMKRINEIANIQLNLLSQMDTEQIPALTDVNKNHIRSLLKEIEDEKLVLLRSILDDGLDPEISTIDDAGVIAKTKLSDFMSTRQPRKVDVKDRRIGKFTLYKGGRDDSGGNNTSH